MCVHDYTMNVIKIVVVLRHTCSIVQGSMDTREHLYLANRHDRIVLIIEGSGLGTLTHVSIEYQMLLVLEQKPSLSGSLIQ